MTKNVGPEDRVVRIIIGLGLCVLIYLRTIEGTAAIVTGIVAAYLLITALLSRCLVYKIGGVDTTGQDLPYSTTDDRAGMS